MTILLGLVLFICGASFALVGIRLAVTAERMFQLWMAALVFGPAFALGVFGAAFMLKVLP
jgi:hypothetical protein